MTSNVCITRAFIKRGNLWSGLFLLFLVQSKERDTSDLDNLETDTRNITNSTTLTTETGNQDFIVFINVVQTTIVGDESSDLLTVLDQLNTDTLTNSRVRLLGFDTNLFKNDTLGVGRTTKGRRTESGSKSSLFVLFISPTLVATVDTKLTGSV